jgi:cytochrome c553
MRDFRDGRKPGTLMPQLAKGYTDAQIDAMSAFFAAQKK